MYLLMFLPSPPSPPLSVPQGAARKLYRHPHGGVQGGSEGHAVRSTRRPSRKEPPPGTGCPGAGAPPTGGQALSRSSPTQGPDRLQCQQILQQHQQANAIPRSTSFDRKLPDGSRTMQDMENPQVISCNKGDQHYRSSPSNQSSSSDPGPCGSTSWSQQAGYDGCPSPGGDKTSSHSSSNTLSSNASSNSDEKHFGSGDLMDPEMLGLTYIKGASTDSGIDTNPCMPPGARVLHLQGRAGEPGLQPWPPEHLEDGQAATLEDDHGGKLYLPPGYASAILEGSIGDLSQISSHS
ncbi:hypothetical protein CRUP_031739, partial [Coryphaenoides rupestris]